MKYLKSKITPPQSIEDFTKDVAEYVQTKATLTDLVYLEGEIEGMIRSLEDWKIENELNN